MDVDKAQPLFAACLTNDKVHSYATVGTADASVSCRINRNYIVGLLPELEQFWLDSRGAVESPLVLTKTGFDINSCTLSFSIPAI